MAGFPDLPAHVPSTASAAFPLAPHEAAARTASDGRGSAILRHQHLRTCRAPRPPFSWDRTLDSMMPLALFSSSPTRAIYTQPARNAKMRPGRGDALPSVGLDQTAINPASGHALRKSAQAAVEQASGRRIRSPPTIPSVSLTESDQEAYGTDRLRGRAPSAPLTVVSVEDEQSDPQSAPSILSHPSLQDQASVYCTTGPLAGHTDSCRPRWKPRVSSCCPSLVNPRLGRPVCIGRMRTTQVRDRLSCISRVLPLPILLSLPFCPTPYPL